MKTHIVFLALAIASAIPASIGESKKSEVAVIASEEDSAELKLVKIEDPALVYQKAFWRRPQSGDRILHAERREWLDTAGKVVNWQWFIVAEPSSETLEWFASNPFMLSPTTVESQKTDTAERPDWFQPNFKEGTAFRDPSGRHSLAFSADGKRLYATDSGSGFARSP